MIKNCAIMPKTSRAYSLYATRFMILFIKLFKAQWIIKRIVKLGDLKLFDGLNMDVYCFGIWR